MKTEVDDPVLGKSVAEVFGEIVWLMTQDKTGRGYTIADLEHLVMPAILLRQFHIRYQPSVVGATAEGQPVGSTAALQPIAVELFAMCSEELVKILDENPARNLSLSDWNSGAIKRTIATFGVGRAG